MLFTPENQEVLKPPPKNIDEKVIEKILTPEALDQPGAKIAKEFLNILRIPYGQSSSYDSKNPKNLQNERILAGTLTNKTGKVFTEDGFNFISRDQRHLLKDLDSRFIDKLLSAMDPELSAIFQNEFEHYEAKKDSIYFSRVMPFAYIRLPGSIDLVIKGYNHSASWQEEHGEYLVKTAKNAKVLCIEGRTLEKFGDSLKLRWEDNSGHYDTLMREAVGQGFGGVFAEIDMRDRSKIKLDNTVDNAIDRQFPTIPDEFFQKYFGYLKNLFPEDAKQIKNSQNLKEILKKLSLSYDGAFNRDRRTPIQNIDSHSTAYVNKNLQTNWEMTGFEYGEKNFSDAMAAIKLHLIANEMHENKIPKGIIVDFEGAGHIQSKYFFLRNPLYAMMTVLKSPHFILMEQEAKKDDISSIYPTFSPDHKMFEDMFKQIWRLELAQPKKEEGKTEIQPGSQQMPMKKYEIPGRDEILKSDLEKLDPSLFTLLGNQPIGLSAT